MRDVSGVSQAAVKGCYQTERAMRARHLREELQAFCPQ